MSSVLAAPTTGSETKPRWRTRTFLALAAPALIGTPPALRIPDAEQYAFDVSVEVQALCNQLLERGWRYADIEAALVAPPTCAECFEVPVELHRDVCEACARKRTLKARAEGLRSAWGTVAATSAWPAS